MSFTGLAANQAVSYTNLQDAVTNGIFTLVSAITSSGQESTKSYVAAHVSGFNANYPPYVNKASNQLIVQGDIYNTGNFILDAQYGMSFTSMTGSVGGLPTFTFPVTTGNTTKTYINTIAAQTITLGITGTRVSPPQKVVLYVDGIQVDCKDLTVNGVQTKVLTLPNTIYAPSSIKISMNLSACVAVPPVVFSGLSIAASAISRTTGQYQVVGNAYSNLYVNSGLSAGYLCTSNDYGATWTKRSVYGYWTTVSVSDDGQYMLAAERYGNVYVSSNYGVSWTITSTGLTYPFWTGSAISNAGTYMYLSTGQVISGNPTGNNYYTLVSTNQGSTWASVAGYPNPNYGNIGLAVSSTGQYVQVGTGSGVTSSNTYGSTFTGGFFSPTSWKTLSASSSANGLIACATNSNISNSQESAAYLVGTTNGLSWADITGGSTGQQYWLAVGINNSGTGYAITRGSANYLQQITTISSVSPITTPGSRIWQCVAISGNGTYILAGYDGGLFRSADGGTTWNSL